MNTAHCLSQLLRTPKTPSKQTQEALADERSVAAQGRREPLATIYLDRQGDRLRCIVENRSVLRASEYYSTEL